MPIRRARSSWRPALASNDHLSFFLTIGTGKGQSSLPRSRNARLWVDGSTATFFFSWARAANATALWRSCTKSRVRTRSAFAARSIEVDVLMRDMAEGTAEAGSSPASTNSSRLERIRSMALWRADWMIQALGNSGIPEVRHCSTAAVNASWAASSARSKSPKSRISVAKIRLHSDDARIGRMRKSSSLLIPRCRTSCRRILPMARRSAIS